MKISVDDVIKVFQSIEQLQSENKERTKQLEVAFEVLEEYVPTEKMDEANNKMILLCKGIKEEIGRDLQKGGVE